MKATAGEGAYPRGHTETPHPQKSDLMNILHLDYSEQAQLCVCVCVCVWV